MIKGIGLDVVDFVKIENRFQEERFLKRFLHIDELKIYEKFNAYKRKLDFVAGRIAAKEAYLKAIGTGIGALSFNDICILNNELGKPYFTYPKIDEINIMLSISHGENFAIAQVVLA